MKLKSGTKKKQNDFATYRPIVVQMTKFVCQLLYVIWFETRRIFDDIVVDWCNRSLTYCLWAQEEIVEFRSGNFRINNRTRKWIWNSSSWLGKESGWHSFLHNDHWKFGDCWIEFVYGFLELRYFVVFDIINLKDEEGYCLKILNKWNRRQLSNRPQ